MKIKLLSLITIVMISCTKNKKTPLFNDFQSVSTKKLTNSEKIFFKSNLFFSHMFDMKFCNDLILIQDLNSKHLFKIANLQNYSLTNFGKRGEGPGELNTQAAHGSFDYKNNLLFITDNQKYYIYNVDSILNGNQKPFKKFKFKFDNDFYLSSTYCNNDLIVGGMMEKRFGIFNIDSKNNFSKHKYTNKQSPFVNQAKYYNHPSKSIVAYFQTNSATMGIMTIEKEDVFLKEKIWWRSEGKQVMDGKTTSIDHGKNPRIAFISATVGEKSIFALYSGKSPLLHSIDSLTDAFLSCHVLEFDWEGNPIAHYVLDKQVRSIAYDEMNYILYAASYSGGEPHLIKYNLK